MILTDSYPVQPNLNLSPEEKRVFGQLFQQADTDNIGVVTGESAVKFFEKTKLPSTTLGEARYKFTFSRATTLADAWALYRYGR